MQELIDDLIEIVTSFAGRIHAEKSQKYKRVVESIKMPSKTLKKNVLLECYVNRVGRKILSQIELAYKNNVSRDD